MTDHGKWSQPGVPHRGWSCLEVIDVEEPSATCEMCEIAEIRYVHRMHHPDYPEVLGVGCICAEHMSEDYVGPRLREKQLRLRAQRRKTWGQRQWRGVLANADYRYLNTEGFRLAVYKSTGGWRVEVANRRRVQLGRKRYRSQREAMDAALDALLWAKEHLR